MPSGDVNGDREVDIGDPIFLLTYLFAQGPAPQEVECEQDGDPRPGGDVNGDVEVDLGDPIYLLSYLFGRGPDPVEFDCLQVETTSSFRFLNNLMCDGLGFTAELQICGQTATDQSGDLIPSACTEVPSSGSCAVRVSGNAPSCGPFEVCGNVTIREGYVYDFVVLFEDEVVLYWFEQELGTDGACPTFPQPGTPPTGILSEDCEPTPGPSYFRFLNNLVCNGQGFTAQFQICGVNASDRSGNMVPSACAEIPSSGSCAVSTTGNTAACGRFDVCGNITVKEGYVHDFVVLWEGRIVLYLFEQRLESNGECPPFPSPGTSPTRIISSGCRR
jgi:hypothetical protein